MILAKAGLSDLLKTLGFRDAVAEAVLIAPGFSS